MATNPELTTEEKLEVAINDITQLAEALMEHISNLDGQTEAITQQIVSGVEEQIRAIVREEIANAQQAG